MENITTNTDLEAISEIAPEESVEVIGVKFRNAGKVYYFSPKGLKFDNGANVIVKTSRGTEFGTVACPNKTVLGKDIVQPLRAVERAATNEDVVRYEANKQLEKNAFEQCLQLISKHNLEMKLIEAEYTFDNSKVIFYFTADGRIDFRELVKTSHEMGIRVMIDGVFNHCGWHFFAFEDVNMNGPASLYWDWFYHLTDPVIVPDNMDDYPTYECFGYERMMPKLATDNPDVQDYFCKVGAYWVREYDIDGWRLDVASEVNDGFWRAFRTAVKSIKNDCALIGEVWESAGHWLDGSMFDSTMNYDFRKHATSFFAAGQPNAVDFCHRVTDMLMRYRGPVVYGQLNLLDSHDVSRFLSLCQGDMRKHQLAVLFQMSFVGMPCVFYGDELGIDGVLEEEYRHPMPWNQTAHPMLDFYKKAIALRNNEPALRRGNFVLDKSNSNLFSYHRQYTGETVSVIMNVSSRECPVDVHDTILWQSGLNDDMLSAYGFVVTKR